MLPRGPPCSPETFKHNATKGHFIFALHFSALKRKRNDSWAEDANPLSLCLLQRRPPHFPACAQRSSSRVWRTRTWPSVSMRESVPSSKLWLEFTGTAGEPEGGVAFSRLLSPEVPSFPAFPSRGRPLGRIHSGCFPIPPDLTVF